MQVADSRAIGGRELDISVVIPCRNGASTLERQLDTLLSQDTAAAFEVIVADNGSTDGTADLVRAYRTRDPRVRLVDASVAPGVNVARNAGARSAHGRFILLCDADDLVHPGWLEANWRRLRDGAHCVGGGIDRVLEDGSLLAAERMLYRTGRSTVPYANGANCGFSAEAFACVGGFDESFAGGADEIDFFWRLAAAGYPLVLADGAVISKTQHTALRRVFRQHYSYGRGEVRLIRKFKGAWGLIPLLALPFHVIGWALLTATSRTDSRWRRRCVVNLAFHLGMLRGCLPTRRPAPVSRWTGAPSAPTATLARHSRSA
ncbi:glycosyltransferase [Mycobacterium sp. PS03-16]|uniref:glycosyltransferase family 2 protein n=1 Tax=Mycobacterium sp. PS03-16 TaxID=2559611 RepID=UPI001074531B|nr:glycosyltransferase [Mycobacterium sp. PS03-16]TFV60770.1 glycosyltransferase [Mycobacterium sp. PS03-16]